MKKISALFLMMLFLQQQIFAFCGFYVSKASGTLTNKTSQVILVRDGNRTVITMSNDFKGDAEDFAMVIPVPVVLKKSDIKVMDAGLFQRLNDYSAPRLVEYYDENPCRRPNVIKQKNAPVAEMATSANGARSAQKEEEYKVKIEAQYTVGEYDIVILSAEESSGLKKWLDANHYKIPKSAEEVLQPYIRSNLKFFVVKVNMKEKEALGFQQLRPLQIRFESPRFMLPIRLGMANADGDQDMIIYAFTRNGRIECTNYRTVNIPTGKNIPLFVQKNFTSFYSNLFQHQWDKQNQSIAFLEYAWDVSPANYVKCDPCVSQPPTVQDLKEAGVWWIGRDNYEDYVNEFEQRSQEVHFTRLHVRYNRKAFPQDLSFELTPNKEPFQARYIITHPAGGDLSCAEGKKYLKDLRERRKMEMQMLADLTGRGYNDWDEMTVKNEQAIADTSYQSFVTGFPGQRNATKSEENYYLVNTLVLAGFALLAVSTRRKFQV